MPFSKKENIKYRRMRVAEMYLAGKWQVEIAKELGVTQPCISQDLTVLRRLWLQSSLVSIDQARSRELAKLDRLEMECWKAWDESKNPLNKSHNKKRTGDEKQNWDESGSETIDQIGDYRFLSGVFNCISKRCEIFGLNAPFKIDATSKGKSIQPVTIIVDSQETKDEYEKLISISEN